MARAHTAGIEEHVYTRLSPIVNRVAWAVLGPDAEFNDVVHDVFLKIFRSVATVRDPDRLDEWAARIAINTIRNELRRRRLRRWVFWNAFEEPGPLIYAADTDGRELLARVRRVLATLPPDERLVLSLKLFETDTIDEIAAVVGCSASTAKRRLKKARERFTRLAECDPLLRNWTDLPGEEGRVDG
jgi:RNA polymerase sigma-70 factor, ECF subfamily